MEYRRRGGIKEWVEFRRDFLLIGRDEVFGGGVWKAEFFKLEDE